MRFECWFLRVKTVCVARAFGETKSSEVNAIKITKQKQNQTSTCVRIQFNEWDCGGKHTLVHTPTCIGGFFLN